MKNIRTIGVVLAVLVCFVSVLAGSTTSTTTTVKDGKRITTKIKTDNKGVTTTTVTTKDKDGTVTTTTTVTDRDGNIVSTDDPEARAKAEAAKRVLEERASALAAAPKRHADDPIHAALFQTVVSEDLRKATTKDGVFSYLRKEFEHDPVLRVLEQRDVDRYAKDYDFRTGQSRSLSAFDRGAQFLPVDVYVETFARLEQKAGINRTTGKLASAPFLVYTAEITSEYGGEPLKVTDEGFVLANVEVTRRFAEKIKLAIRDRIGPGIPQEAVHFRRATEAMSAGRANVSEALKSIFKRK